MRVTLYSGAVFAGVLVAGAAIAAPAAVPLSQAVKDGVAVCRGVVQSGYASPPDRALTTDTAGDVRPGNLKGPFFKDASDVKWVMRPSTSAAVFIGWSSEASKCSVFVLGGPAGAALEDLRRFLETTHMATAFGDNGKARGYESPSDAVTLSEKPYDAALGAAALTAVVTVWAS